MTIIGIPEHLKNYSLAVFHYFATGEGDTTQIQLLCDPDQILDVGYDGFDPDIIPAIIEKTVDMFGIKHTYLDWNPEFKAEFFANFGAYDWQSFTNCCIIHKGHLDLIKKSHFNLS